MENHELKFVKGACKEGQPADIYFYTDVDYWSVEDFLWEFKYLIDGIKVSKINIHINSAGGSCIEGMSVFSRIMDCPIPTACYNDGLAASMGSIIWAAGKEVYMKDYALLMIHNPFIDGDSGKIYNQVTEAFTQQLKIIYQKRFGLSEDEIEAVMNGEEGNDGTFFTAAQAVEKGFITPEHIINTPEAQRGKISAILKDGFDMTKLKAVMNTLSDFTIRTSDATKANTDNLSNNTKMEKNEITVFAALLGLTGEKATTEGVSALIDQLKQKASKYDDLQASMDGLNKQIATLKTELEGSKASVKNLTTDLEKANGSLKVYMDAEADARVKAMESLVDGAISAGKIDAEDRDTWLAMAKNDFATAEKVLDKIPSRQNIGEEIAKENGGEAKAGTLTEEQRLFNQVDKVVGKDFKFKKMAE